MLWSFAYLAVRGVARARFAVGAFAPVAPQGNFGLVAERPVHGYFTVTVKQSLWRTAVVTDESPLYVEADPVEEWGAARDLEVQRSGAAV